MRERMDALNEIFDVELSLDDLDKETGEILEWDSFHIMNFMMETEERFHKKITIEQIAEVKFVRDLIELMKDG